MCIKLIKEIYTICIILMQMSNDPRYRRFFERLLITVYSDVYIYVISGKLSGSISTKRVKNISAGASRGFFCFFFFLFYSTNSFCVCCVKKAPFSRKEKWKINHRRVYIRTRREDASHTSTSSTQGSQGSRSE